MPNYDPSRDERSRGYDIQRSDGQRSDQTTLWAWLTAALTSLGLLVGGIIGHSWGWGDYQKRAESSPPATTGSAPSQNR
jgi:hypothetical protein